MKLLRWLAVVLCVNAAAATADAVMYDGSLSGDGYGAPRAVQTTETGFGDDLDNSNVIKGSELNAAFGLVSAGNLNLALTGNLEDNFNKLVLFIDSIPGGINTIDGFANPIVDPSPFPPDPGMLQKMHGFTFDSGFNADYVIVLRHGFTGVENRFDVDFARLGPAGVSSQYLGVFLPTFAADWSGSGATGTGVANALPISVGFDNSNILGVTAGDGAADQAAAAAVATGVEVGISLADIGNPTSDIKITAFVTGSNHDFLSNQFLGGLGPTPNLGAPGFYNLRVDFAGNQFFTVAIPEPSAALFVGGAAMLGLITTVWARRAVDRR
jgi:hypothetical protein